jgi:hypothetical protein
MKARGGIRRCPKVAGEKLMESAARDTGQSEVPLTNHFVHYDLGRL